MVNTSLNWVSIVGIVLMLGGALLFSLRTYKPALSRDTDVFFAAVGLLCGGILFFQGWRLDPILQFSQFLLATTTVFFVYESVRLRGVTAEQARRSEFMDDPERDEPRPRVAPIGSGLDEWDTFEQRPSTRRRALAAADRDQFPSRQPIRRAPEEEPPEWSEAPPIARKTGLGTATPPARDPNDPSDRNDNDRSDPQAVGRHPVPSLSLPESGSPRPVHNPRTRRADDRSERPLVSRRQRRPVVRPEPFDQDPNLKLARSVPRASLPPQGKQLNRNQNTTPFREPKSRPEDEQDNSGRFDD